MIHRVGGVESTVVDRTVNLKVVSEICPSPKAGRKSRSCGQFLMFQETIRQFAEESGRVVLGLSSRESRRLVRPAWPNSHRLDVIYTVPNNLKNDL